MRFETSVVINQPVEEVWAFLADPFNIPRWHTDRLAARVIPPGPLRVGSTLQLRIVFGASEIRLTYTVTEWDPPHAFTRELKSTLLRSNYERFSLEVTADGTKVMRVVEVEPRPILNPLLQISGSYIRHRLIVQNQNLKRVLEAGPGQ